MPITGPSSYLSTTDEFIAHWTAVNALLAPLPANLTLEGNRTLATLTGLRTSLAAARADVAVKRNGYEFARADAVLKRIALRARAQQVIEDVAGSIPAGGAPHFETLAGLPVPGVSASYRVYAITADGNERASNTVTVTRPA